MLAHTSIPFFYSSETNTMLKFISFVGKPVLFAALALALANVLFFTYAVSSASGFLGVQVHGAVLAVADLVMFPVSAAIGCFIFKMFDSFGFGPSSVFNVHNYRTKHDYTRAGICAFLATGAAAIYCIGFSLVQFPMVVTVYLAFVLWMFAYFVANFIVRIFMVVFAGQDMEA